MMFPNFFLNGLYIGVNLSCHQILISHSFLGAILPKEVKNNDPKIKRSKFVDSDLLKLDIINKIPPPFLNNSNSINFFFL
jgi:hypothetical protein